MSTNSASVESDFDYSDSFELDISEGSSLAGGEKTPFNSKPGNKGASSSQPTSRQTAAVTHNTPPPWPSKKLPLAGKKVSGHSNAGVEYRNGAAHTPVYKTQHLGGTSEERDGQIVKASISSSPNQASRPLHFKEVAGRVHTLQSASESFKTSREIRDIAHKEWLAKKEAKKMQVKELLRKKSETMVTSEETRKREMEKLQKSMERVDKWVASKKVTLQEKAKQLGDEAKRKKKEEQAKKLRILEGERSSEKWCQMRTEQLVKTHRQLQKKKKDEERRKTEEREKKEAESKSSFESWKQQKDRDIEEKLNMKKSRSKELEKSKRGQAKRRESESQDVFEKWKTTKDKDIRANKTLFTYDKMRKVHERAWRPARGVQYSYPQSNNGWKQKPAGGGRSKSESLKRSPNATYSIDSYSNASFESEEFEEEVEGKSGSSTKSSSESADSEQEIALPTVTGRHRTIQVCCQTLQYWCTCKDPH